MIRIGLCDDEEQELLNLSGLLESYKESTKSEYNISYEAFKNSLDLLAAIESGKVFDILLLDIVMPQMNGIKLAKEIRRKDANSKILFLSTTSDFAVESYEVEAFHYIVKPIRKDIFFDQIARAVKSIVGEENQFLLVKSKKELRKVRFNEIQYAEIIDHTIYLHLRKGELVKNFGTMEQLESALCADSRFIKPHRSYLLNMDCIESISPGGIRTTEGKHIPISRKLYKSIRQAYIDYSLQQS
ncbi:MAG: response regulator transcription factor [Clostridia bacterium]|nr:response regulator transcription factor [Clostridia bacterium]